MKSIRITNNLEFGIALEFKLLQAVKYFWSGLQSDAKYFVYYL